MTHYSTSPPSCTTTASIDYDGDGLRTQMKSGGSPSRQTTSYVWDVAASLPVILQAKTGGATTSYLYGLDLVSATDNNGVRTYLLQDGLGSTTGLTDGSGSVTATYQYDAFGAVKTKTGNGDTTYRFTGELHDSQVARGPYYLRARYYDPALGRFLSRDRLAGFAVSPQSLNRYAYTLGNPVVLTDPTGLQCIGWLCFPLIGPINWEDPIDTMGEVIECATDPSCLSKLGTRADAAAAALSTYRAVATDALTLLGCAFGSGPGCMLGKFGGELVTAPVGVVSNAFSSAGTVFGCVGRFMSDPKEGGGMTWGSVGNCAADAALTIAGFVPEANIDAIAADYQLCRDLGKCWP